MCSRTCPHNFKWQDFWLAVREGYSEEMFQLVNYLIKGDIRSFFHSLALEGRYWGAVILRILLV
jgi:hypothetical protein